MTFVNYYFIIWTDYLGSDHSNYFIIINISTIFGHFLALFSLFQAQKRWFIKYTAEKI
jgi:hypothetical protein